jgi:hypothetical protein
MDVLDPVEAGGKMGRIVGHAIAQVVAPQSGVAEALMGGFGAFLGRRKGRGYPLLSFGTVADQVARMKGDGKVEGSVSVKRKRKPRAPRAIRKLKSIEGLKKPNNKP